MKFGRTGLAVLGLFAVSAIGCPQPSHKKNDGGADIMGGEGGDGGATGTGGVTSTGGSSADTGGSSGSTGGSSGSTGGSSGSTGGSSGSTGGSSGGADAGSKADSGGGAADGGGAGGAGGGADMTAFMTLYTGLIKPKCGPACHITGNNGGLMMPNAMAAYMNLVNKPAMNTTCKAMMRVVPGDPAMSVLIKKVSGTTCGTRMPAGTGKQPLTAAEIQMISDWIKGP